MSNNTGRRGSSKSLRDTADVASTDHVNSVVASIEQVTPTAPTLRPAREVKPVHQSIDGKGALVWKTIAPHEAEVQWDPHAPAIAPAPLPISSADFGLCVAIAKRRRIPVAALDKLDPATVRLARLAAANVGELGNRYEAYEALVEACRT